MNHQPFYDERLSPQENKACEMLFNGMTRDEIADELDIGRKHLAVVFYKVRKKGIEIPRGKPGAVGSRARVPIDRLVEVRSQLMKRGFMGAGLYRILAERVGMSENCVTVRLWRYDRGIGPMPQARGEQAA